jgi:hypothetical protein
MTPQKSYKIEDYLYKILHAKIRGWQVCNTPKPPRKGMFKNPVIGGRTKLEVPNEIGVL